MFEKETSQEDIFEYMISGYFIRKQEVAEFKSRLYKKIFALYDLNHENEFYQDRVNKLTEALTVFFDRLKSKLLLIIYGEKIIRKIYNAVFSHNLVLSLLPEKYPLRRILILGETGSGKENIAELIYEALAIFGNGKVEKVNAAAFPEQLLESEMFGHEKGAFTGAVKSRTGLIETVDGGGVLFLDEIGDASKTFQANLLRVLENGEYRPVGSDMNKVSNFHFVSATNYSSEELKSKENFRFDLYQRICSPLLEIPPFRDILADKSEMAVKNIFKQLYEFQIKELYENALLKDDEKQGLIIRRDENEKHIIDSLMELYRRGYRWDGNIRECIALIREGLYQGLESFSEHINKRLCETGSHRLKPVSTKSEGKSSVLSLEELDE